jgi:hypothetical protein
MRDALGATSQADKCDKSHITDLASPDLASTVCFCIFMGCMHACELHASLFHPPAGAPGSTVRVEVLRLPP